jgi:hypothetical protein
MITKRHGNQPYLKELALQAEMNLAMKRAQEAREAI